MTDAPGLRERKNERTREAIERAALELALEQGYDHTTVDQIAARADVAPRTVFSRYPTKDAIIFGEEERGAQMFREWLEGDVASLVDRLGDFLRESVGRHQPQSVEIKRLRLQAMLTDPYLRRALRGRLDKAEELIAARIADDLDLVAGDSGPRVLAAAITGLFLTMAENALRYQDQPDEIVQATQNGLAVLSAGMAALRKRQ